MSDTSIEDRLQGSPELQQAIRDQIAGGLFERLGLPRPSVPAGGDELESLSGSEDLESIVQRVGRPPLLIQNNTIQLNTGVDDSLVDFPPGTDALIIGAQVFIPSVGRVEFVNHRMAWGGTGWVINEEGPDRIVVTNRHVAAKVAKRAADGRGLFMRDPAMVRYQARVNFKEELGSAFGDAFTFEVKDIPYLAGSTEPDVAFLRITGADLPSPLPLADDEAEVDEIVALIGYPAFDDRNDIGVMAKYFRDLYDVKRFAPGKVIQPLAPGVVLRHDCTSLGGNSGSPLIRLSDCKVVGLHFAGEYGIANSAVGVTTLRALLAGERPVSVTIAEAAQESADDGFHDADHFAGREGYDAEFLGSGDLAAPWPGLPPARLDDLAEPSDDPPGAHELRYTHFGVKYSVSRRQPVMTAANIDGLHPVKITRTSDKWFQDGRLPMDQQLRKVDYDDEDLDRGHMVRREDPNWDDSLPDGNPGKVVTDLAKQANLDTFHYPNAAVQHGDFNSGVWLGLEKHLLGSAQTHGFRACVFTGPVFRDDEPIGPDIQAPREFWKIVVMEAADGGRLHATAYVLSHGELIHDLIEERGNIEGVEGFEFGEYKTFQFAIADLATAIGYDFSAYAEFDPLADADGGQEALDSGEPLYVPLDDLDQIVL